MKTLVYFGSAFNPPHLGHMQCLQYLVGQPGVAKVLAGPSKAHAYGKDMAPFETRVALTRRLLELHGIDVEVSTIEADIEQPGSPVYTYDVLVALQKRYPTYTVAFGMGPDNALEFSRFYRADDIKARFPLVVVPSMAPTRSTELRAAARSGNCEELAYYTDPSLVDILIQLYR